jgi:hypothetical protein
MALSYHLFTLTTQVTGLSDALQYATAIVLVGLYSEVFRDLLDTHQAMTA